MSKSFRPKCPLVYIDDSADDHFLFQQAALQTETPLQIQPFFSADPAIAYLKGKAPFADTIIYPPPFLLLCDYDLGTANGSDVVAAIRDISSCASLPIIMFSGSAVDDAVAKSYAAGADYFLCKPTASHRLEVLVQTFYACATANPRNFDALVRLPEYQRGCRTPQCFAHADPPRRQNH
jgi:CheY-like chemotaxis protein